MAKLIFDPRGGTASYTEKQVLHGKPVGPLPEPRHRHYDFAGWYDEPLGGGVRYTHETVFGKSDAVTLYAKWTAETLNTDLPDTLPLECRCCAQSPFYLRWLNRFGGIDYWMFEKRQVFGRKINGSETFRPVVFDYSQATGTDYAVSLDASERVTAGAERLSRNEWYELSRIAFSPAVQWYDERTESWKDVLIDKGDNEMITDGGGHAVEYEILLPAPQIQL